MKREDVQTALVISGGSGDGLGLTVGALKVLVEYWKKHNTTIDGIIGTSQGAISGAWFAENPTPKGIAVAEELYLSLTQKALFGRSGLFLEIELAIRAGRIQISPNSIDSILEGDHLRSLLGEIFKNRTLGGLSIHYGATVIDCSNSLYRVINTTDDPTFQLRLATYASAAQVPYLDPLQLSRPSNGDKEYITLADGGGRHVIPFESAAALYPNLKEVWVLAKHGVKEPNRGQVKGALSIGEAYIDGIVNQNIAETLERASDGDDGISTHIIITGTGAPEAGFYDFTDRLGEFVVYGELNAKEYLRDPQPKNIVPLGLSYYNTVRGLKR